MKWAFPRANPAGKAMLLHKLRFPAGKPDRPNRTARSDLADLAATAFLRIIYRDTVSFDAKIIQTRFHAAIWASAYCNFKLMRKLYFRPAQIITFEYVFCHSLRIKIPINAGCTFAGSNRADLRTCTAKTQPLFRNKRPRRLNLRIRDANDFRSQPGSKRNFAVSKPPGASSNCTKLIGSKNNAVRKNSA